MVDPVLLALVKRKLNVTWEDPDTTARIEEIIESAIPDMIHILGISDPDFDFAVPGKERTLFLNRCLYEWNHALAEFQPNYANDISQVRERHELTAYSSEVTEDADT